MGGGLVRTIRDEININSNSSVFALKVSKINGFKGFGFTP